MAEGLTVTNPTSGYVGDIYARVTADIRPIKRDLKKVQDEMAKMKRASKDSMTASAKSVEDMHGAVRKLANGMTTAFRVLLAFKATAAVAKGAWDAVMASARATETENKFKRTFDEVTVSASRMSERLAQDFDLANSTAQALLGTTGDLLSGFGFTDTQAKELSETANRLALDLVSFQNIEGGAEYASEALTKAMLGNTRQAKELGIVIRQDTDEFREQVRSLMEANDWTVQQAKAVAILNESMKQSKNAIGDYNATQKETMNVARAITEQQKEAKEGVGALIEVKLRALGVMEAYRDSLGGIAAITKDLAALYKKTDQLDPNNMFHRLFISDETMDEIIKAQNSLEKAEEMASELQDRRTKRARAEEEQIAKAAKAEKAYRKQNLEDAKKVEKAFEMIEQARVREWKANLKTQTIISQTVSILTRERQLREQIRRENDQTEIAKKELELSDTIKLRINTLTEYAKKIRDLGKQEKDSFWDIRFSSADREKQELMLLQKRAKLLEKIAKSRDLEERKKLNLELLQVQKERLNMLEEEDKISRNARFGAALVKGTQEAYSAEMSGFMLTLTSERNTNKERDRLLMEIRKEQLEIEKRNNQLIEDLVKAVNRGDKILTVKNFRGN